MARHTKVLLASGIAALGVVPAALALLPTLTEQPVLTGPRNETQPAIARASSADVLIWTQSRAGHRDQFDAYLRRGSGAKLKLNLRGLGFGGDVNPPWVTYQQIEGNKSDIKLYRLDKRKRVPAPRGLNTSQWERRPRMSGNWLLFARDRMSTPTTRLILFNRKTGAQRVLATGRYDGDNALSPGQINGNWAVWYKCSPVCDGFLYNIARG